MSIFVFCVKIMILWTKNAVLPKIWYEKKRMTQCAGSQISRKSAQYHEIKRLKKYSNHLAFTEYV